MPAWFGQWLRPTILLAAFLAFPVGFRWLAGPFAPMDAALHEHVERHPEEFKRRLAAASEDPVLRPMIAEIQAKGMDAAMRYYHDEELLRRFSQAMGGVPDEVWEASDVPLLDAVKEGVAPAVRAALRRSGEGEVDARDSDRGMTALAWAAAYGHAAVAAELLTAGADARAVDKAGNSVLHFAAGYGRAGVCQLLAERLLPADAESRNAAGQTPADVARINGHDVATLLGQLLES